jgi:hypothetical protein
MNKETDYIKYNKQPLDYYYKNRDILLEKYKKERLNRTEEEKENMRLYQANYYYMVRKPLIQLQKKLHNPNYRPRELSNNNKKDRYTTFYYPKNPSLPCYVRTHVDTKITKLDKPIIIDLS